MADHFVFIASGGRTGTNFLGEQLKHCIQDCWSEHEPDMFAGFNSLSAERMRRFGFNHVIGRRIVGRAGLRVLGTRYLKGDISFDETARRLRAERATYHRMVRQSLLVESYGRWWMFADRIDEVFPGCKMLAIVRDPRSWIASWLKKNPGLGPHYRSHLLPPGPVTPEALGDERYAARWNGMNALEKIAWHWNLTNTTICNAARNSDNIRVLRFEDLFSGDKEVLEDLAEFLADFPQRRFKVRTIEPLLAGKINASSAAPDDWTHWSDSEKALVNEICGETMEYLGYEPIAVRSFAA